MSKNYTNSRAAPTVRYRLLDQRRFNRVTILDKVTDQRMIMPALDIARNSTMIKGFYPEEACLIGVIAGQACLEPQPPMIEE